MAVINLGQFGQPRESSIGRGLRTAATGFIEGQKLAQREKERKSREKLSKNQLSSALASQTLKEKGQDIANVRKTYETFSSQWNAMDADKQKMFKATDQYKEVAKFLKSFNSLVPGLVDAKGDVIPASTGDLFENKFQERVAQAKLNIASGNVSPEDKSIILLDQKVDSAKLKKAVEEAQIEAKAEGGGINFQSVFNKIKGFLGEEQPQAPSQVGQEIGRGIQEQEDRIRVRLKSSGQTGTIGSQEFNSNIHERL